MISLQKEEKRRLNSFINIPKEWSNEINVLIHLIVLFLLCEEKKSCVVMPIIIE